MLLLNLKFGEYLAIGEDTYIQFFKHSSTAFRAAIHAPKNVTILRGEVHERTGERPEGLHNGPLKTQSERRYDARHYEEWIKKTEARAKERQKKAEEKSAVLRELSDLAAHVDELIASHGSVTVREQLTGLCSRLEDLETAQERSGR